MEKEQIRCQICNCRLRDLQGEEKPMCYGCAQWCCVLENMCNEKPGSVDFGRIIDDHVSKLPEYKQDAFWKWTAHVRREILRKYL
jgi:hypothetical protein